MASTNPADAVFAGSLRNSLIFSLSQYKNILNRQLELNFTVPPEVQPDYILLPICHCSALPMHPWSYGLVIELFRSPYKKRDRKKVLVPGNLFTYYTGISFLCLYLVNTLVLTES